jgi:hypothetical protein
MRTPNRENSTASIHLFEQGMSFSSCQNGSREVNVIEDYLKYVFMAAAFVATFLIGTVLGDVLVRFRRNRRIHRLKIDRWYKAEADRMVRQLHNVKSPGPSPDPESCLPESNSLRETGQLQPWFFELVAFSQCTKGCWLVFQSDLTPELFTTMTCPRCQTQLEISWLEIGYSREADIRNGYSENTPIRFSDVCSRVYKLPNGQLQVLLKSVAENPAALPLLN